GLTFSAPVRVNDAAAPASVSGEQPPRVALVTRAAGDPSTVVVWTTKSSSGTQLVTARSDDGAKPFARSQVLPGADASGNRGWESIITTRDGQVAAVWLDHRELAAGTGPAMPMNHDHAHPQEADGASKAQLSKLYFSTVGGGKALVVTGGVCYCCKTGIAAGA